MPKKEIVDFLHRPEVRDEWNKGHLPSFLLWIEERILPRDKSMREEGFNGALGEVVNKYGVMNTEDIKFEDFEAERKVK